LLNYHPNKQTDKSHSKHNLLGTSSKMKVHVKQINNMHTSAEA